MAVYIHTVKYYVQHISKNMSQQLSTLVLFFASFNRLTVEETHTENVGVNYEGIYFHICVFNIS